MIGVIKMNISVFLSYPQPHMKNQQLFIDKLKEILLKNGIEARTLGVSDYDMEAPLKAIRCLMLESNGLLSIAFRRSIIEKGIYKPDSDMGKESRTLTNEWLTSPFCQIEPAMAFQIGLPILIFREKGVLEEGILEKGVLGIYMPEFDLDQPIDEYFKSSEFIQIFKKWELCVRKVVENKSKPPKLY